ncbi:M14 family metallopeptidase [Patiriisocius marinus]|uniref:M14 family metallopeptidase n=1 Tax=Patiriisocius marinus TaxID=1397112 RepID=UPI001F3D0BC0|nr:M14 family metallopeptidase [Patiriisocius marinus]
MKSLKNTTNSILRLFSPYKPVLIALLLSSCSNHTSKNDATLDLTTLFETSNGEETAKYSDVVDFYKNLANSFPSIQIFEVGTTDSGNPLHVITFSTDKLDKDFENAFLATKYKNTLLINNGIHPGESDGIDASMLLLRDLAQGNIDAPKNTIIAIIPIYNVGGALNRNSTTRTNQVGPLEYGFRGNARNYDLNRDFIKTDTKNAQTFNYIFRTIKPQLFIDNHVSNGADYQYTLTHLFTQHNKLGGELGQYLNRNFMPQLEDSLSSKGWDITPYVNVFNTQPEVKGFSQFMDSPRYSTGYTTLYNTLGMMVETHMLKPYKQRVEGTYELMKSFISIADAEAETIKTFYKNDINRISASDKYPIRWAIDSSKTTTLQFKGYEGKIQESNVTGKNRLKFDRTKPFTKPVTYYNYFKSTDSITVPEYYIIPRGQWEILDRLKLNNISVKEITQDTLIDVEVYHIDDYKTRNSPYEGHYLHYNTSTTTTKEKNKFTKGDFIVNTHQDGIRYLLETLEPSAVDSFFNWNFFDTILQQKEGFSPYVWEDKADKLLKSNPALKIEFDNKKATDKDFEKNWYAQLDWLHKKSSHYEKAHLRYPIVRVSR